MRSNLITPRSARGAKVIYSEIGYLSLTTGVLQSEPGGGRAAFATWYVQRPGKPDPLLTFGYIDDAERSIA